MTVHYTDEAVTLHHGDCLDVMATLPDSSVDAIVTDPPYGLGFMGREWDDLPPGLPWAQECLRVLKPGGHLLAFGGSRTWHRLASAIEDAGFEIRDSIFWIYGSGFPKSLNVTDALGRIVPPDARCVCGPHSTRTVPDSRAGYPSSRGSDGELLPTAAGSDPTPTPSPADAPGRTRDDRPAGASVAAPASTAPGAGTGHPATAGSPGPRRPLSEVAQLDASSQSDTRTNTSTVPGSAPRRKAAGTLRTSGSAAGSASSSSWRNQHMACPTCGGVVIPAGLGTALKPAAEPVVVARKPLTGTVAGNVLAHGTGALNIDACRVGSGEDSQGPRPLHEASAATRYTEQGAVNLAATPGPRGGSPAGRWPANVVLDDTQAAELDRQSGTLTSGANPTRRGSDKFRDAYGDFKGQEDCTPARGADSGGASRFFPTFRYEAKAPTVERPRAGEVAHPTVKPLDLMRWLVRLVTPPGGVVLEPFAGSGTTAEACVLEGMRCIAIEREADYLPLIVQRLSKPLQPGLFG